MYQNERMIKQSENCNDSAVKVVGIALQGGEAHGASPPCVSPQKISFLT